MTRLRLAVSQADENPPSRMTGSRWLSFSKQSSEVLLRTYHVELHSMLLTISPFMFWDDSKTFTESIFSLFVFWLETEF